MTSDASETTNNGLIEIGVGEPRARADEKAYKNGGKLELCHICRTTSYR